jgi:hypothetical protein
MSDYMDSLYENLNEESIAAITAAGGIGFNDGANNGFWRFQPRDFKGRWAEMGAEIRAAFKLIRSKLKGAKGNQGGQGDVEVASRKGFVVGSGGTPDTVRVYHPADEELGLPEEVVVYNSDAVELIGAELSADYLRSKGINPDTDVNGNAVSYKSIEDNPNIQDYASLPKTEATDDDRRLATDGANTPEGAEMSQFKDSPEGQEIAKLPAAAAANVAKTSEQIKDVLQRGGNPIPEPLGGFRPYVRTGEKLIPISESGAPKRYKGLKETSPESGVWDYKEGKDNYRLRQNKAGKWEIYADAANSDYEYDTPADRRGMRGTFEKLDSGDGYDSVDDVMDKFFGAEPIAKRPPKTGEPAASKGVDVNEPVQMLEPGEIDDLGLSKVEPGPGEFQAWESETGDGELVRLAQDGMGRWVATSSKWSGSNETGGWNEVKTSRSEANAYDALDDSFMGPIENPDKLANELGFTVSPSSFEDMWEYKDTEGMRDEPTFGVDRKDDGTYEATNYLTGETFEGKDKKEALDKVLAFFDNRPETLERDRLEAEAEKKAADAKFREENNTPKLSREEFGKKVDQMVERYYDEETGKKRPGTPEIPTEKQIDEFYDEYSQGYDFEGKNSDNIVDGDTNSALLEDAINQLESENSYPDDIENIANDLVQRAMDGEPINLDDISGPIGGNPKDMGDGEEDNGDGFDDLKGPSEDDLMDISSEEESGFNEDADWNEQRSSTERVAPYEVGPGDFIIDPDGDVARIEDVEELPNGDLRFTTVNYDGGPDNSFTKSPDGEVSRVEFGGPADTTEETTTPTPSTTKVEDTEAPQFEAAPATAKAGYAPTDIEAGDEIFTNDGARKLGNVTTIRKKTDGSGGYEARLEEDGRQLSGWWDIDEKTVVNKPNGDKAPEVPETPTQTDAPTANAAGFTENGRQTLEGMTSNREATRQSYGKALSNGRTATVVQDDDGSWFLEKHDEFDGGILETKRFDSLQEALDEGNTFLDKNDPKFDVNPEPEPVVVEPEAVPEIPSVKVPDTGELKVATPGRNKKPKVDKTDRVADPDEAIKPSPMETDDGTSPISFNPPPPGGPSDGGDPDDPSNPLNIRNAKVDVLRDAAGNTIYEADEDGNPIYDDNGKKIPMQDPEAVKALVKKFFPNAKETSDGLGITIWRQSIDGQTYDMGIKRTDAGDHAVIVGITDEATGERKEYISVAPRKSWQAVWNLRKDGGGNSPFAIYNLITGNARSAKFGNTDYSKKKDALQRFQYYRNQKSNIPGVSRFATVEEIFTGLANGRKEKLNFSLPIDPKTGKRFTMEEWMKPENENLRNSSKTWLSVRASEIGSLKDAIEHGLETRDWSGAYFLMLNMKGKFPQDLESLAKLRNMLGSYFTDALPDANRRRLAGVITTLSNLTRSGLKNPSKLETPYIGADGHTEITEGMWVKYKNILGEWSVGQVSRRRPSDDIARPTQSPDAAGYQHHDQVVVKFADGTEVDQITSEHLFPLKKGDAEYGKPTPYKGKPTKKRRISEREALAGLSDMFDNMDSPDEEGGDAEPSTPAVGPSKVDDLAPGGDFFSKSGDLLGQVVDKQPIVGKNGKAGFAIAYVTPEGETKVVKVAAGELRGPKA